MQPLRAGRSRISRRVAVSLVALAVAPAALGASTSNDRGVVHAHVDRSGTVVVTGYDGGVPLAPSNAQR